jgi:Cft2 family RNA processing exonuclease
MGASAGKLGHIVGASLILLKMTSNDRKIHQILFIFEWRVWSDLVAVQMKKLFFLPSIT